MSNKPRVTAFAYFATLFLLLILAFGMYFCFFEQSISVVAGRRSHRKIVTLVGQSAINWGYALLACAMIFPAFLFIDENNGVKVMTSLIILWLIIVMSLQFFVFT